MKFKSGEILRSYFFKLKKADNLTMRSWSNLTKVNTATLSQIINSKKLCPARSIEKIAQSLGLDQLQKIKLLEAYAIDLLAEKGLQLPRTSSYPSSANSPEEILEDDLIILRSWLHLTVLEMVNLEGFKNDISWISKSLGVSSDDVKRVLVDLKRSGYLVITEGQLAKKFKKMRVPATRSREIVRHFHSQMLKKAIWELENKISAKDYSQRRITGYTVTGSPEKIAKVQELIEKFMNDTAEEMSQQKPEMLYQLQVQLFPLMKKID